MKKNYTKAKSLFLILSALTINSVAQISGVVTINSGAATGGTNYNNFTDLANALNTSGVNGALTVNVASNSGPYNEQPNFNQAPGISGTNSVLINGNGNTLTFNSSNSAQPWTLGLGGADYMSINSLTVLATGTSYGIALKLYNQSSFNLFTNCTFSVMSNSQSSTNFLPVNLSGVANSPSGTGTTAQNNNNTWKSCRMINGYAGFYMYGYTGSPYTLGNQILDCEISDFYAYGIYSYYNYALNIKGNTIHRPTATNITTFYGIMLSGTTIPAGGTIYIDGNRIREPFGSNTLNTNTMYCIYPQLGGNLGSELHIRNNLLESLRSNGAIYGILSQYNYTNIYHNTISLDDAASPYTSTCYGIYWYNSNSYCKNNLITISRGGTGQKYGFYVASTVATGTLAQNNNNVYIKPGTPGTSYYGYHWQFGTFSNWNSWIASTQMDLQGGELDPGYIAPNAAFVWPTTNQANFMPSSQAMNDKGQPVAVGADILNTTRSNTTPDIGAYEFLNVPCSGITSSASVITPTLVYCPGNNQVSLSLSTTYTNNGMTFNWQSSTTSQVGPFTSVPGGTTQALNVSNLNVPTWYQAVITCTNGNSTAIAVAGQIQISGVVVDNVPYFEGFEGITKNNELPNCSWSANNLPSTCQTYTAATATYRMPRTGSKFASFYYNPGNTNYFYTNGIYLNAGVTYSASVWYLTEMMYGYHNWTDFSLLLNTSKTAVGASTIASTGNAAIALAYKPLSNTFSVQTSGIYYVIIRGIGTTISSAQYLSWDDLAITIPCTNNMNTVPVGINASATSVCSGMPLNLTATGADSYTWNTGDTTASIVNIPFTGSQITNSVYVVTGKSSLSGCTTTLSQLISVKPTPVINLNTNTPVACEGTQVNLSASGALTYSWSNGANGSQISVAPAASTDYTVLGTNNHNCIGSNNQLITIHPKPTVLGNVNPASICAGQTATLTATGSAVTYQWVSNSTFSQSNPTIVSPIFSTIYTLTGTDINGCTAIVNIPFGVDACTGLNNQTMSHDLNVYPNPTSGLIRIESASALNKVIEISDVTGRHIRTENTVDENFELNLTSLASGVYYVKVQTTESVSIIKVIKQ